MDIDSSSRLEETNLSQNSDFSIVYGIKNLATDPLSAPLLILKIYAGN
jgi:hypothetical protein